MDNILEFIISVFVVSSLVFVISKRFRISKRYERKVISQDPWSAQDAGLDPTSDGEK